MNIKFQKVTNDTFLKVFESNILENSTAQKPEDSNKMKSELKLMLNNDNYNLTTGFLASEVLEGRNSDRYQYVLPYYDFDTSLFSSIKAGSFNFNSNGSNELNDTNSLKSQIVNNLIFQVQIISVIKVLKQITMLI